MLALEKAIKVANGQTGLARLIQVQQANVWNWLHRDKKVPGEYVLPISRAVGFKVTPHELRPDIYPNPTDGLPKKTKAA